MKTIYLCLASAFAASAVTVGALNNTHHEKFKAYEEYLKATDELLWEIEEMCEYHGINWGDTICEGNNWDSFCEVRSLIGLEPLVHWSEKGE